MGMVLAVLGTLVTWINGASYLTVTAPFKVEAKPDAAELSKEVFNEYGRYLPILPAEPNQRKGAWAMFLWISGFLKDDAEGDALKFDLVVKPEYEDAVLKILGWESLDESPDGEWQLSVEQLGLVSIAVNEPLPSDLDVFIGVRS